MPVLKNTKHEYFAQGVAKGKTQMQAYIDAGYSKRGAEVSACQLLRNSKVQERIAELKERAAQKTEISIAGLTTDLLRLAKKSEQLEDSSGYQASRAALMDAAKLNGLIVEKTKSDINHNIINLSENDKAQIAQLSKSVSDEY